MNKRKLFLIGCCVSGDISKRKELQRKLQVSLQNRGETPLLNSINIHGKLGCISVVNKYVDPIAPNEVNIVNYLTTLCLENRSYS